MRERKSERARERERERERESESERERERERLFVERTIVPSVFPGEKKKKKKCLSVYY